MKDKVVQIEGIVRKWGNSYGVALPKGIIEEAGIKINETIEISLHKKKNPLREVFGKLPPRDFDLDKVLQELDKEMDSRYE